jgi:hypothetical protein
MSNFLDMRCPKYGDENRIDIEATLWVRVTEDGTVADASGNGQHDYTPKNLAFCGACLHGGTVADFSPPL